MTVSSYRHNSLESGSPCLRILCKECLIQATLDLRDLPPVAALDAENVPARKTADPEEYPAEV